VLLILAVVASVECNFGPPPSVVAVTPADPVQTIVADVAFDVNCSMRTTKNADFELVLTFPSGRLSIDGAPQPFGPVGSRVLGPLIPTVEFNGRSADSRYDRSLQGIFRWEIVEAVFRRIATAPSNIRLRCRPTDALV
jgi:hypothetical protein